MRDSWVEFVCICRPARVSDGSCSKRGQFIENRLSWTVFKADGTTVEMSNRTVECDAKGNVIRFADLNHDGSVRRKATISYEFDDHGNWTRKETNCRPQGGRTDVEIIERTITYY